MAQLFDDIFRTLCEKNPHLLIPLINEAFHKNYPMTEKIELLSGEHHILSEHDKNLTERITDSAIRIGSKLYHLECQSSPDGTMVLRMPSYISSLYFLNQGMVDAREAGLKASAEASAREKWPSCMKWTSPLIRLQKDCPFP